MRHATDPRVLLDVALVRIANPAVDDSPGALLERIERLERSGPATGAPASAPAPSTGARAALGSHARRASPEARVDEDEPPLSAAGAAAALTSDRPMPSRDELTIAWADNVLPQLKGMVKALFAAGRFVSADQHGGVLALPTAPHRQKCEERRKEVEAALATHFGRPVPLRLVVEGDEAAPLSTTTAALADEAVDLDDLVDAPAAPTSSIDRLTDAFPGAELLTDEN